MVAQPSYILDFSIQQMEIGQLGVNGATVLLLVDQVLKIGFDPVPEPLVTEVHVPMSEAVPLNHKLAI